jgi:cell division protein FtsZ
VATGIDKEEALAANTFPSAGAQSLKAEMPAAARIPEFTTAKPATAVEKANAMDAAAKAVASLEKELAIPDPQPVSVASDPDVEIKRVQPSSAALAGKAAMMDLDGKLRHRSSSTRRSASRIFRRLPRSTPPLRACHASRTFRLSPSVNCGHSRRLQVLPDNLWLPRLLQLRRSLLHLPQATRSTVRKTGVRWVFCAVSPVVSAAGKTRKMNSMQRLRLPGPSAAAACAASRAARASAASFRPGAAGQLDGTGRAAPKPVTTTDDEQLEIPAFLRRQAN